MMKNSIANFVPKIVLRKPENRASSLHSFTKVLKQALQFAETKNKKRFTRNEITLFSRLRLFRRRG
jgi:hypothetical protein